MDAYVKMDFDELKDKKTLIVYYSRNDNIEKIAKSIHKQIGGNLYKLEPQEPYPTNEEEYIKRIKKEKSNDDIIELKKHPSTLDYDVIYVGTPIVAHSSAPVVNSFLRTSKLSDKIVLPFSVFDSKKPIPEGLYRLKRYAGGAITKNILLLDKNKPETYDLEVKSWTSNLHFTRRELKRLNEE